MPPCSARATAGSHGKNFQDFAATVRAHTGNRAPEECACIRLSWILTDPQRIYIAISAAGAFRTEDGGTTWKPINRGTAIGDDAGTNQLRSDTAFIGSRCTATRPNVLFMQKHWDVMRSDDGGDSWREVSGNLPTDFGFPIDVHAHEPETIYVVPIKSDSEHYPPEGKLRVYRSRTGGNEWEPLTKGLPQNDCYVNVLRDAMAVDSLDSCGVYFGTTGGQVYASADAGTIGLQLRATFQPSFRSRCKHCHDPCCTAGASSNTGSNRRRGTTSSRRAGYATFDH